MIQYCGFILMICGYVIGDWVIWESMNVFVSWYYLHINMMHEGLVPN